ncbi:MAG: nuclear transport factor 2 family protein [bacterium]|nr:nuclear transport factor 2 family protein [bacterium]
MRKHIFMTVLCLAFLLPPLHAVESGADAQKENAAIVRAAMDYMEGWYEGNVERMIRALHPELAKRQPVQFPKTGKTILNYAPYSAMIEYVRAGFGKKTPKDKRNIKVKVLDVFNDIACVRASSAEYYDYLHLAKINGQWKIINVLWQMKAVAKK